MIELLNAELKYGKRVLLDGLSLQLPDPGLYAIEGPTASGKSLLGKLLAGVLRPSAGKLLVDGVSQHRLFGQGREALWYLPVEPVLPADQSIAEYLQDLAHECGLRHKDWQHPLERMEALLGHSRHDCFGQLSSGEIATLQLALSGLLPLRLIVLDGQLARLDPATAMAALDLLTDLRQQSESIVLLLETQIPIHIPGLLKRWQLAGGLPVRCVDTSPLTTYGKSSGSGELQVAVISLRDSISSGHSFQSGRSFRLLSRSAHGLRVELMSTVAETVAELEAEGYLLQSIALE
jgi:ABC-type cobalamin/Fe3+-siderophores transport system ATPase subunit